MPLRPQQSHAPARAGPGCNRQHIDTNVGVSFSPSPRPPILSPCPRLLDTVAYPAHFFCHSNVFPDTSMSPPRSFSLPLYFPVISLPHSPSIHAVVERAVVWFCSSKFLATFFPRRFFRPPQFWRILRLRTRPLSNAEGPPLCQHSFLCYFLHTPRLPLRRYRIKISPSSHSSGFPPPPSTPILPVC